MTHHATKTAPRSRLSVLIPLVVVALGAAGCSSSDSDTEASSAGPSLPTATSTAATSGSPATSTGNDTKAVCTRVIKIIQDSSRSAISTLTPALQTGDQKQVAAAQVKAHAYYREAADRLRKEAASADTAALRTQINNAAGYFDKAAASPSLPGADNSLATLSQTCTT